MVNSSKLIILNHSSSLSLTTGVSLQHLLRQCLDVKFVSGCLPFSFTYLLKFVSSNFQDSLKYFMIVEPHDVFQVLISSAQPFLYFLLMFHMQNLDQKILLHIRWRNLCIHDILIPRIVITAILASWYTFQICSEISVCLVMRFQTLRFVFVI